MDFTNKNSIHLDNTYYSPGSPFSTDGDTLTAEDSARIIREYERFLTEQANDFFDSIKTTKTHLWLRNQQLADTLPEAPCHPSHYPARVYIVGKCIDKWIASRVPKAGYDPYMSKQTADQIPIPEVQQLLLCQAGTGHTRPYPQAVEWWIPVKLFMEWYVPE